MKHNIVEAARYTIVSLPAWGDWIETCSQSSVRQAIASLPVWYIFQSVSVHLQNKRAECHLFRSIPIHFTIGELQSATFPVHIRSLCFFSVIDKASVFFRCISVHFDKFYSYFCTENNNITSTSMSGTVKAKKTVSRSIVIAT